MKKLFLLAIVVLGFTAVSFAQATATASATLAEAGSITNAGNMNFGNLTTTTGGTLDLDAETGARTPGTGVQASAVNGVAASFNITGTANTNVTITLPTTHTIQKYGDPSKTMTVESFTTFPVLDASKKVPLGPGGAVLLKVGATLNTGASPDAGLYESPAAGGFAITAVFE